MFSGWKIKFSTNLALRLLSAWLECRCTTRHSLRKQSLGHARDTPQLLRRSRHNVLFLVRFHIFAVFASTGLPCSLSRSRHVRFHGPAMFAFRFSPCSLPRACHVRFQVPVMFSFIFRHVRCHVLAMLASTGQSCTSFVFPPCSFSRSLPISLRVRFHVLAIFVSTFASRFPE